MTQCILDENEQPVTCSKYSDPAEKIRIFRSLFKGREDVFAKRWQNKKGASGYSPVCSNEWQTGICQKPKGKCSDCTNNAYVPLNDDTIDEHLRGNMIAGVYPLLPDECCWFLALIRKLSEKEVETLTSKLCQGNELGVLKKDEEETTTKPWETVKVELNKKDFPESIEVVTI